MANKKKKTWDKLTKQEKETKLKLDIKLCDEDIIHFSKQIRDLKILVDGANIRRIELMERLREL